MKLSNLTYKAIGKDSFTLDVIILIIHSAWGRRGGVGGEPVVYI